MEQLLNMGFNREEAGNALKMSGNDVERAVELLCSGVAANVVVEDNRGGDVDPDERCIPLSISQYTFGEQGSSACTVIAASMMKYLLEQLTRPSSIGTDVLHEQVLTDVLISGVTRFNQLFSAGGYQHLAADELGDEFYDTVRLVGPGALCLHRLPMYLSSFPSPMSNNSCLILNRHLARYANKSLRISRPLHPSTRLFFQLKVHRNHPHETT